MEKCSQSSKINEFLAEYDLCPSHIVTDLPHAQRILVNDFSKTNQYPSARSVSIPRDNPCLGDYLV